MKRETLNQNLNGDEAAALGALPPNTQTSPRPILRCTDV